MAEPMLIANNSNTTCELLPGLANRHGLITGATGTGKTVSLQTLAENFSRIGVPVFMADVKGDLTGISQAGGISKSPASACSSLVKSAKSELLPAPLRPTRPTFSPGLMVVDAPCSTTLTPRRRLRFLRVIIGSILQVYPRPAARVA